MFSEIICISSILLYLFVAIGTRDDTGKAVKSSFNPFSSSSKKFIFVYNLGTYNNN